MNQDTEISSYRQSLLALQASMQAEYDRTVLALSGGALGISMTFTRELVSKAEMQCSALLLMAWICWGFSASSILASFFTSSKAMETAIRQADEGKLHTEPVGGFFDSWTKGLNIAGGALFLAGVLLMTFFVGLNLK